MDAYRWVILQPSPCAAPSAHHGSAGCTALGQRPVVPGAQRGKIAVKKASDE